jgi:ParB family chromosome partitioning protein
MHHHHRKKGAITMPESTIERVDLDPTKLLIDVNIRKDARLDKDFVASIKELGVLVPLIAVRTATGEVRVRFGHRRTLAAIEAGLPTVPVEIVGDEAADDAGQIERILGQYAENVHRSDLTAGEKIEVVAQLSAFGVKAGEITKKTRITKKDVKAAITVAGSDLAKAASERYDFLTLEQAAGVAEFQDDGEAVKRLILAAQQGGFDHHVQRLREDRQEKVEIAKAEAELTKQGIAVIESPEYNNPVKTLVQIRRTKKTLTDQAHASCPGHAAFVEAYFEYDDDDDPEADASDTGHWVTEATYVCTDPVAYGHLKAAGRAADANTPRDTSAQDAAEDAAREERRRVLANNKAWRSAETVRRDWLKTFLSSKTPPKDALRFILAEMADPESPLDGAMDRRHPMGCELLGAEQTPARWMRKAKGETLIDILAKASESRAQVIALGLVLGAHENTLSVDTWRRPQFTAGRYLAKITEWGYGPSEIEQTVIDRGSNSEEDQDDEFEVPTCRKCGCTDEEACEGGCSWVEDPEELGDLCSACAAA